MSDELINLITQSLAEPLGGEVVRPRRASPRAGRAPYWPYISGRFAMEARANRARQDGSGDVGLGA